MSCHASSPAPRVRCLTRGFGAPCRSRTGGSLILAGLLLASACNIGGHATEPSAETADISAVFLENPWFTLGRANASLRDNVLSVSGSDGWYAISLVLQGVGGPGSYSVTAGNSAGSYATLLAAGKTYSTVWGGSGQLVVDSLWTTGASGTFFFTAVNPLDHRDSIRVQNGVFHVKF